jgi:autotransporter-associated beta strand protein
MVGLAIAGQAARPRRLVRAALLLSTALTGAAVLTTYAVAQDATWKTNPNTSWFGDSSNWSTNTVPTGVASFGQSTISSIINDNDRSIGTIQFNADARAYNFSFYGGSTFTFTGGGIVNNGSQAQIIEVQNVNLLFQNSASAGNNLITYRLNSSLGKIEFSGTSTAGSANFTSIFSGQLVFKDTASGGTAALTGDSSTVLDISGLTSGGTTIGSIAGGGSVVLGFNQLAVGGNNSSTTYSGVISGSGRLVKEGTGTLTLTGANSYLGHTTVNAGTLRLGASGVLVFNRIVNVGSGATLDLNNFNTTLGQVIGDGSVTLGSGTLTVLVTGGTFSGVMSGTGGLVVSGGGSTYELTGSNTYSGGTTVGSGTTLSISSDAALGNVNGGVTLNGGTLSLSSAFNLASTRAITIGSSGGTIDVGSNNTTISGAISGSGGLTKQGTGTLTLSGTNDFAGLTIVGNNVVSYVAVSADNQLGTAGAGVTANTLGFLKATSSFSSSRSFTLTQGYAGFSVDAGATLTWDGVISGTPPAGGLTVRGPGTLVLTGTNTYVGSTAISSGTTLQISSDANLGNASNALTFNSGTLAVTSDMSTGRAIALESGFNGTISVSSGKTLTYSGIISGDASSRFIKSGAGVLVLTGANTYTGGTTVSGGTLIGTTNTLKGDITNNGTVQFNQNLTSTYYGNMSGSGRLVVTGNTGGQYLVLAGANTYSGGTTVSGPPALMVSSDGALGSATGGITLENLGTLRFGASFDLASTRAITIGSGGGRINTNGFDTTISQSITGTGFLEKEGAGTLTFAAANSFSSLSVSGGVLVVSANNQLGAGTSAVSLRNNATLRTASSFSVGRFLGLSVGGGTVDVTDAAATLTWGSEVYGSGTLTKAGAGKLSLIGINSFTGATAITGGTLAIAGNAGLGNANNGVTFGGGTLQFLNSFDLAGTRAITLNAGGGTIDTNGFNTTISQVIGGDGGLTKAGAGTLTLTGVNTYLGATGVSAGTLVGSTDNLRGDIVNDGTVTFDQGFTSETYAGAMSGSGSLVKSGLGVLVLTGTNSYAGGTTLNDGTLRVSADANLGGATGTLTLAGGRMEFLSSFDFAATRNIVSSGGGGILYLNGNTVTVAGSVSGPTGLSIRDGKLILTGNNTIQSLDVRGGTLAVASVDSLGLGTRGLRLAQDGTLQFLSGFTTANSLALLGSDGNIDTNGFDATLTGQAFGGGRLVKKGTGALTLTGSNSYTGGTLVSGGALAVSSDDNLGTGGLTLDGGALKTLGNLTSSRAVTLGAGGGTVDTDGFTSTFSGPVDGAGRLSVAGTGKLSLTGANAYSGGTTISGGSTLAIAGDAALGDVTGGITFDNGTLQWLGTFNLASTRAITLNAGGGTFDTNGFDTTISQSISGGGRLTKSGTGTLYLAPGNTYTGGTTINGGTISIGVNTALGNATGGLTFNGGTLRTTADISLNHAISLNGNGTIDNQAITRLNGVVSGPGDLTKTGGGVLALIEASTFTGRLIVNQSVVVLQEGVPLGNIVLASGASVNFQDFGGNNTYAGVISGDGRVAQTGNGTLTLSGNNTYSGGTTVGGTSSSAVLAVSSDANLGNASGNINFSGGKLRFLSSFDLASTRTVNINNFGGIFSLNGATPTFGGVIENAGRLTIEGPGTMTFTGANTYSGGTYVEDGATLAVGSAEALGTGGLVLGGGTLKYLGSFDFARTVILNPGSGTFDTNGFNSTISTVIGGDGGLTKAGAGTLTLTGNNTFLGDVAINGGVLAISAGSNLGAGNGLAINNGTLRVSDVAAINRQTTLTGAATFDIVDGYGGFSVYGNVGGSGSLIKTGAGALTLRDTANYTGGTTVSGGNLTGSTASLQGNIVNNALVYFGQDTDGTYAGVMSGTGTLSKFGSATLTLTGLNTHQGGTHVTAGTIAVGQDANLGDATADISLRFGGTLRLLSSFDLSSGRDVELVTSGRLQLVSSTNEIAGVVHGTSTLAIEGPGTLTLSGTNTFTGATSVTGSTLAVAADANLGDVNNSLTLDGATLQFLSSFNLAGTRAITLAGGSKFDTNGFNTTISQTIAGTGGLAKIGNGTLSLTGANTYSGSTIISGGTLAIGSDGALGNVNNGVTFDSGTLQLLGTFNLANTRAITLDAGGGTIDTNSFNTTISQVIGGQGGLTKTGAGTLTLSGTNTYAGTTTVSGGVLAISSQTNLGTASSVVLDGGTLRTLANRTFTTAISLGAGGGTIDTLDMTLLTGVVSGNGGLTKIGSSLLYLLGANTYLGGTTVNGGAIYIETDGALGNASGGVTLNNGGRIVVGRALASNRSLTLGSGGGTFDTGSYNLTWNGVVQGTAGLTKWGTGTLILSGTNTYTGDTAIERGSLQISSDANLGVGGRLILTNDATLRTAAAFTIARNVESVSGIIDTSGNDVTISGVVSGTSLSKQGLGTLTLTGTNSYSATSIQNGTLAVGSAANISVGRIDIDGGTLRVTGGTFALNQIVNLAATVGRIETDGGARLTLSDVRGNRLEKAGFGTLVLSGNQTYTGGTSIVGGTLAIGSDGALGAASGGISFDGGTLQFLATFDLGATRAISLNAGLGTIDTNSFATTIAQVIDGAGGLAKAGAGTLTLSGANTYRGGTMVTGGALYVSSDANLGDTSGALTIGAGGALVAGASFTIARNVIANGGSIADGGHTLTVSGNISGMELVKEGAGTLILTGNNTHLRTKILGGTLVLGSAANAGFDPITIESGTLRASNSFSLSQAVFLVTGDISVDAGANLTLADVRGGYLNKRGAGTLTLTGANSYSPTALYEGTLAISSDDNLGTGAGTLYFAGGTLKTLAGLTVNRSVSMIANGTVDTNGLSSTFNGVVDGGGRLTVTGGGSLTLAGANTFTGGTLIAGGSTVAIGSDAALGAPTSNVVFDDGTLKFLAGVDLVAARPIVLEAGGGTLDLTGTSTINGPIDGSGALTVTGAGTLTLSNVNTYSGGTILKGGVLRASMDSNLGAASGALVFDGGTLQLAGNFDLGAARAITLNAGGGTIDTNGFDTTAFQAINGIGGLTKAGAGLLTLMASNTYSGGTTVTGGVLQLGLGGSLLATGALTVNGGIFDLNGNNQTVGGLSGTGGTLYLNGDGELTVNQATTSSFAGSIEGSGKLIKTGSGTLTLSGSNTHTGGTAISDGTLSVSSDAALGATSSVLAIQGGFLQASATFSTARTTTLQSGGGFDVSNGATLTHSGEISGSGYLVKTGLGTLVLSGTNTYTAETVIGMGTLKVTNNAALGAASATLRIQGGTLLTDTDLVLTHDTQSNGSGNTLRVDAGTTTLQGAFSGWGTLTKSGAGTLKLVGTSSYSGTTTVLAGTLQGDTSTLRGSINNQAQVVFDQDTDGSFTGVISNTGTVTKRGSGVVTFDANQSYEGGTTVAGGTLRLGTGATLSTNGSLTVNAGTFDLNGNNQTVSALAGTGGTVALGSGTLTVDQATNTSYAGAITGSGAFVKEGTGTLTLTGANTYSGGTTVNGGILRGTTESLQGSIVTNAAVYFFQATTGTYAGAMSGSGSMLVTGGGTVILTGNSTYSGNTTVGAGNILQLGAGGTTGSIVGDVWANGTLAFNRSDDIVFAGSISGIGDISLMGPGAVTLTGTNSYTGGTTVISGTLIGTTASLQGAIVNNATVVFDQASDGVYAGVMDGTGKLVKTGSGNVTLSGANSYSNGTAVEGGTLTGSTASLQGAIATSSGTFVEFAQNADGTYAGVLSGAGSLIKSGSGNLTLTGANTYSGGTTVSAGTLTGTTTSLQGDITNNASVVFNQNTTGTYAGAMSGSGSLTVSGGGTVILTGNNSYANGTTIAAGTILQLGNGGITGWLFGNVVTDGTLAFNRSGDIIFAGDISGSGGVSLMGPGSVTLIGNNTFTGAITVGGTIRAGSDAELGPIGNVLRLAGGTVQATATFTSTRPFELTSGTGTFDTNGNDLTLTGVVSGAGTLVKTGTGSLILSGANTYSGGTTVSAGTLVGTATSLQGDILNNAFVDFDQNVDGTYAGAMSGSGRLTKSGSGNLTLTGANTYSGGTVVLDGTLTGTTTSLQGNIASSGAVFFDQATAGTYAGILSGSGNLIVAQGDVTLAGANTYSGTTTVLSGATLRLGSGGSLGATRLLDVNATGTFDLGGRTQTVGGLTGAGAVTLGAGALTVDQATNQTFSGSIDGSGSLTKAGSGTLILAGTSSYSGGTTVSGGILQGTTDSLQGGIVNNAAVVFDQATYGIYAGNMSGTGALTKSGNGILVLTGTNSYSGGTTVSAGTLAGTATSLQGAITNDAVVSFTQNFDGTYAGVMSGSGQLVVTGIGELKLTGANSYSGGTSIGTGVISVAADAALGAASGTLSFDGGTLRTTATFTMARATTLDTENGAFDVLEGTTLTQNGDVTGPGGLIKQGGGTLVLGGTNSYGGGTTVQSGTLQGTTTSLQGDIVNNAAVVFDQSFNGTYAGAMSGSGSLTKAGSGTVILTGALSYTGGTVVNGGILRLGAGNTLPMLRDLTVNGGTFDLGGNSQYVGTLSGTGGTIDLGAATLTVGQGQAATYGGVITGTGRLVVTSNGGGEITLTGANTYTGGTTVDHMRLIGTTDSLQGNIIADGATIIFDQEISGSYAGVMSGSGGLVKRGGGIVTLTGANTYAGSTAVYGGTLRLGAGGSLSAGVSLYIQGGTFDLNGANQTVSQLDGLNGNVTLGSGTLTVDQATDTSTGVAISGAGRLVKTGAGRLTLGGTNSYTNGTIVSGGTLAGTTFSLQGAITNDTAVVFDQGYDGTYAGVMDGGGSLTKTGIGNLTLSGANTYSGGTTVSAGTLTGTTTSLQGAITNNAAVVFAQVADGTYAGAMDGSGTLTKTGIGNLTLSGANTYSGGTTVSAGTLTGTTTSLQGAIVNNAAVVFDQNTDGTYAGAMSGTGALTKSGTGNLTLTGANTYSGGTTVSAGVLTGTTTSLQGNIVNNAAVAFDQAFDGTYAAVISGTGSLTKQGIGILTLSGANTYGGGTTFVSGTVAVADNSALGAASGVMIFDEGTLRTTATFTMARATTLTAMGGTFDVVDGTTLTQNGDITGAGGLTKRGGGTLVLGGTNTYGGSTNVEAGILQGTTDSLQGPIGTLTDTGVVFDQSTTGTFGGTISGAGSLTKNGSGTVILAGSVAHTGSTTVNAGTLQLAGDFVLNTDTTIVVNDGTFDLNGHIQRISGLSGTGGTVDLGAAGGHLNIQQDGDLSYAGSIVGGGRITKAGIGTLTLTGANTYSGGTTVAAGTLRGTTTSLQGDIAVVAGAHVVFDQSTIGIYAGDITQGGALTITGGGAVVLTGTVDHTGGTTIAANTILQIGNGGTIGSLAGDVVTNGTLSFYRSDDIVFAGDISGSGGVTLMGSGSVTLTGTNTYTGATTVGGGVIIASSDANLGPTGNMLVLNGGAVQAIASFTSGRPISLGASGGTFDTNGNELTLSGTLSGAGRLTKVGAGTLILAGTSSYSGGTTVSGGILQGTTDSLLGNITNNATVAFSQVVAGTYAGIISGTGAVSVDGDVTFTGANTYSGGTTIASGALLSLGGAGSIQGNVANSGTMQFAGTGITFGGVISGSGAVQQVSGTTVLTGVSTYTGGTVVTGGTLQMGAGGALAATGALTINDGTFDLNGNAQTVGALAGAGGAVTLGGGTLTVDQSSDTTFAGSIGGAGTFIKAGSGTLILAGTGNQANTVVSGGILQGTTASLQGSIVNNAGVVFNQSTTGTYAGTMSGTGSVTVNGGGIVVVTGANTYSGGTTIATGSTLQLGVGGTTGSIAGNVAVDGTLTFYRSDNIVFAGNISGSGGIKLMGTGSVDFTGTNSFTGGVSVGGILRAGSDSQLGPAGSTLTLDDGTVQATAGFSSNRQIVLAGAAGTFDTNGFTLALTGVLSGSGNLIKVGTGTLVLVGTTSYTGDTFVNGGTLQGTMAALSRNIVNNAIVTFADSGVYGGIMSGTGALLVAGGTTVGFSGANTYTGGTFVQAGGTLDLGMGSIAGGVENEGLVRFANASPMSFGGSIAGSGSLLVDGSLVLTGANSYTGTTQIEAGTLQLGLGGSLSSSTLLDLGNNGGTFDLNGQTQTVGGIAGDGSTNILLGSGALTVDQAANGSFGGQIGGSGSLIKSGAGTLALTGSNTQANTIVNGGTLQLGAGGSLAAASTLAVNGGTFDLNGQNQTVGALSGTGGTVGLNGGAALTLNQNTDTSYAGAFTGNGSLVKDGSGTLALTGASSHTGGTVINNGTLQLGAGGSLASTGAVAVNGGTFDLNGQSQTVGALSGTGGTVALSNNGALTVNQTTNTSYAGVITGSGSLTKSGSGTLTLTGTNTYTGGTTVSGGTLAGTTSSLQGNIVNNANVTFDQVGAGVYAGAMSGTGTLTKSGAGTVVLTGENVFSGGTIITGGILQIGNGGTTGSLAGNVQNDGTLAFFRSDNITFGGDISGTGGLLFMGNATVTLTGNNTFTGGIAMGGGTLVVGADSELGGAGSTLTLAGSTVQATASFTSNRAIILATGGGTFNTGSNVLTLAGVVSGVGGLVVGEGSSIVLTGANTYSGGTTISSGALLTLGGSGSIQGDVANSGTMQFAGTGTTFGGVISGSGAVQQVSGTTVLTGNSLHTGGTTISGGTLQLGVDNALTMAGALAINGGTFDLNGYAQTIGELSGTGGGVALNGGALTVNQTGNTTYAGIVSGTGSFIKDGSGTLVLTGANTNANTVVNGGTLQGTTSSLQGNIANNATVVFDQAATGTYAGNMSGNGGLTKNGNGALILSGDNSGYAGTTTVNAGLLQIGDGVGGTAMAGNIVNNAAVTFMASGAGLSYGGSISGSGSVAVAGSAQTTLTGTHSYTGGTTVTSTAGLNIGSGTTTAKIVGALTADGGLANFVNADMSGMGAITARNGGTLGFSSSASAAATALLVADAASALAFSDASTAGTSTITNSGNVRFTGNSSGGTARYIGSSGDLSIAGIAGSSTTIGSIEGSGTVSLGNKQLAVGGNNQSTQYNGVIGGAGGSLLKQGTGTLTLTGNNTYSGGTTVTGGLVNFATLGNFGTGNVTLNGGGVQWAAGTSTDISVRLAAFGVNGGTLDTNGNNVTLANGISGPGSLTKAGDGVLTLAGNNTYTGGTFVTGGSIALTGSIAGPVGVSDGLFKANGTIGGTVTVSGSGTLGGSGTVGGIVVDGGIVAPGNSIGTLTVTGNYVQSGGIYQVEVNSSGQADRINVTGTATLNGGTVQVLADQGGTYARNTSYTILTATGGITGTYSNVTSNLAFLTPTLSYSGTSVTLMLEMLQSAFRNAAQTPNQAAVGAALDAAAPTATGDFANVINALSVLDTQQGPAALTAISGQNYSALSSASVQSAQLFMSNFSNQASGATRGGPAAQAAGATNRVQLAEACDVACDTAATGLWGAWGGAIGGFGTIGGNSNSSTVTYNLGGFAGGIDRQVTEELLVGFTLGYSSGTQWTSGFSGRSTSNTYQAGLYGSFLKGPVYVDGLIGYAYSDNQMLRQIQIPGLNSRVATGQTGTNQFFGQIEAGYRIDLGTTANAYLTPWARLQGSTATQNGLTESGADSLNLIVASQTTNSLRSVLGVTLGGEMDIGSGNKLAGQFKVGWAHEFANTDRPVTASFVGAPAVPFTTYGAAPQRDGVILGLNATANIGERTNLFLRYEGEFQGIDNSHALSAGIRFTW